MPLVDCKAVMATVAVESYVVVRRPFEERLVGFTIRIAPCDEIEWVDQSLDEEFSRCLSL